MKFELTRRNPNLLHTRAPAQLPRKRMLPPSISNEKNLKTHLFFSNRVRENKVLIRKSQQTLLRKDAEAHIFPSAKFAVG